MKYSIVTFGCRVNQADSLQIEEQLLARGGVPSPAADADLVVVNTCSVTASADQGARQTIRRIASDNPRAEVVVTGCYATRRPDEVQALPNVVRVVRNHEKDWLVETTAERFGDGTGACGAAIQPGVAGRTAFTLRVQTGCEERCSYCIIPTTRGAGRSMAIFDVLREVRSDRRRRLQGDRADRRPPWIVRTRPGTGSVARRSIARARRLQRGRDVPHQLARADGLHARRSLLL